MIEPCRIPTFKKLTNRKAREIITNEQEEPRSTKQGRIKINKEAAVGKCEKDVYIDFANKDDMDDIEETVSKHWWKPTLIVVNG